MKIETTFKPTLASSPPRTTTPKQSEPANTQEAVSFSQLAGSLKVGEKPPVNSTRIQEIKEAISAGRFSINSEAIADRLIESAKDLIKNNRRQA